MVRKIMSNAPKYDIGTVVYFRSSAAKGFLEAVRITITTKVNYGWIYGVTYKPSEPQAPAYFGDRISLGFINPQQVFYTEDEFVLYCEALGLAEQYYTIQLSNIQSLIANNCGTSG